MELFVCFNCNNSTFKNLYNEPVQIELSHKSTISVKEPINNYCPDISPNKEVECYLCGKINRIADTCELNIWHKIL